MFKDTISEERTVANDVKVNCSIAKESNVSTIDFSFKYIFILLKCCSNCKQQFFHYRVWIITESIIFNTHFIFLFFIDSHATKGVAF